jgi:hypothetical protein
MEGYEVRVDHGAQFFTARDPLFKKQVSEWVDQGVCFEWAGGFHQWDGISLLSPENGRQEPRYACELGMSHLAKSMTGGFELKTGFHVSLVERNDGNWKLTSSTGSPFEPVLAKAVFCSAPVPQSLALIKAYLPTEQLSIAEQIAFKPCLAVIVRFSKDQPLASWNGVQVIEPSSPLSWIGRDSSRRRAGCSPPVAVLHASSEYSLNHSNDTIEELQGASERLIAEAARIVGSWFFEESQRIVHRWRYAFPESPLVKGGFIRSQSTPSLFMIGDGFNGARLEGAWLSGHAAAKDFLEY